MSPARKRKNKDFYNNKNVQKQLFNLLSISAAVFLIILSLLNIQGYMSNTRVLGAKVEYDISEVQDAKKYWEELVSKNPTYYDGWEQLYKINIILGNQQEADNAYSIAKRIDFNR